MKKTRKIEPVNMSANPFYMMWGGPNYSKSAGIKELFDKGLVKQTDKGLEFSDELTKQMAMMKKLSERR